MYTQIHVWREIVMHTAAAEWESSSNGGEEERNEDRRREREGAREVGSELEL